MPSKKKKSLLSCFSCFSSQKEGEGSSNVPTAKNKCPDENTKPAEEEITRSKTQPSEATKTTAEADVDVKKQAVTETIKPQSAVQQQTTLLIHDYSKYDKRQPLAEARKDILKVNKPRLQKELILTDRLIGKLWNEEVITTERKEFITLYHENRDRVNALLAAVNKGTNAEYDMMCEVLSQNKLAKVVNELLLAPVRPMEPPKESSSLSSTGLTATIASKGQAVQPSAALSSKTEGTQPPSKGEKSVLQLKKTNKTAKRSPEHFLSKDRWNIIRQNKDKLSQQLEVSDDFLELLEAENVITAENKRLIQYYKANSERVEVLLEFVLKMKNADYDKMCEALYCTDQGDVVKELLVTEDDFWVARRKIAEYYNKFCKDCRLIREPDDESMPTVPQLHVPVSWKRLVKDRTAVQDEVLDAYYKIFSKLTVTGDSRVVVEGEQGAGKTTLLKRLCRQWAQLILSEQEKTGPVSEEQRHLKRYNIVVFLYLRYVHDERGILEIFKNQFKFLSFPEIHSVITYISKTQRQSMLMLDGLNEMGYSRTIHDIIRKEKLPDVRVISTSDFNGLKTIKQYGTKAMEQHLKLLGFEKKETKEYAEIYFSGRNDDGACATDLIEYMNKQKPGLWDLGRLPLKTEMICVVWEAYWETGNRQIDLFHQFIERILYKIDQLSGCVDVLSADELKCKYDQLLANIAKLANSWKNDKLQIIFNELEVKIVGKSSLQLLENVGLLRKSVGNKEQWEFCHIAFQEYFVAYHINNFHNNIELEKFSQKCGSSDFMLKAESILRYICNGNSQNANLILKNSILKQTDQEGCQAVLQILLRLAKDYESKEKIELPLPKIVDTQGCGEVETMKHLFETDAKLFQNLKKLTVDDLDAMPNAIGQEYLQELILSLKGRMDTKMAVSKFDNMRSLEIISLDMTDLGYSSQPVQQVLDSILPNSLRRLTVAGYSLIAPLSVLIDRFCALEELVIKESGKMFKEDQIQQLSTSVDNCEELKNIKIESNVFHPGFLLYEGKVGLELEVTKIAANSLQIFVDKLKQQTIDANIVGLYFCNSDLCSSGPWLGQMLLRMKHLAVFSMNACSATWETIERILATSKKAKETFNFSSMVLIKNFLQGSGAYLGELVERTPTLKNLVLRDCQLNTSDLDNIQSNLPPTTVLQSLEISDESLGGNSAGVGKFWKHMPKIQRLELNSPFIKTENIKQFFDQVKTESSLTDLRELVLSKNQMHNEGIVELSKTLLFLPHLEKLDVSQCAATNTMSVFQLISNIPPTLTHLNISLNDFGHNVVLLKEAAWKFIGLQELRISGQHGTEYAIDILANALKQINPNLTVNYF